MKSGPSARSPVCASTPFLYPASSLEAQKAIPGRWRVVRLSHPYSIPSPWELHMQCLPGEWRMKTKGQPIVLLRDYAGCKTLTSLSAFAHPELCFANPKLITGRLSVKD